MKTIDLFPTTIHTFNMEEDLRFSLYHSYLQNKTMEKEFTEVPNDTAFLKLFEKLNGKIKNTWFRCGDGGFDIHSDSHQNSSHIAICWIDGSSNCGGDLILYDPAWRNPQSSSNRNTTLNYKIEFEIGKIIIFPSYVWHKVTEYTGKNKRIVFNVAMDFKYD